MDVNLIMTDYSMPGMTGYELLKKIKVRNDNDFCYYFDFGLISCRRLTEEKIELLIFS